MKYYKYKTWTDTYRYFSYREDVAGKAFENSRFCNEASTCYHAPHTQSLPYTVVGLISDEQAAILILQGVICGG